MTGPDPAGVQPPLIRVACAVEGERYVHHCAAMLHSLLVHHPPGVVEIEYLHGNDTSAKGRRRLAGMVENLRGAIRFHEIPAAWTSGLPVRGFTGRATWYRLFLPQVVPEAGRILYLDCDLCVTDSLTGLVGVDLRDNVVGAVTNVPFQGDRGRGLRLGLPSDHDYFNAGVLLIDLARMGAEEVTSRALAWARPQGDRHGLRDQDALNVVLHDRRLRLHPRWNCMNMIVHSDLAREFFKAEELAEARRSPAVRHFEGPEHAKPWHLLSSGQSRAVYRSHRLATPWPRYLPTGLSAGNVVRRLRERRS